MALPPGTRIGPFEIAAQIGEGGMGEVYRAVDSNLGRSVAIKVLPDSVARDAERLARFEREAKTLASLNHPNIAQVFGLERSPAEGGHHMALVMELVEGPTLADRIAAGPVPLDESVTIAIQIAEALESAHEQGIVHRDLKPANVKVRDDGTVKVLDFGLAKAMQPEGRDFSPGRSAEADASALQTITSPAVTQAGVILGTAAYMSPEQAKGRVVNQRADIWAFGCVLFEMLSGTRAFAGEDISDVLVSVLRDEPDWQRLPPSTPAHVRALLRRCLQKDVKKRLPHIGVARLELAEGGGGDAAAAGSPTTRPRMRYVERLAWALAGAAVVGGAAFALKPAQPPVEAPKSVRFDVVPPEGGVFIGGGGVPRFALSPDGRAVVYQASSGGQPSQLWLQPLDGAQGRPLTSANSESAASDLSIQQPFWSPDSRQVGFFDEITHKVKIADLGSGVVRSLCDFPGNQAAGDWSADGVILFSTVATKGIQRIAAGGGSIAQVTRLDESRGEVSHLWPSVLPDGKHFVYLATGAGPGIYLGSIDGGTPTRLFESTFMARVAPPDQLLFVRGDALVAQQMDFDRLELTGEPVTVADSIMRTPGGRVAVSASQRGDLVFAAGEATANATDAVWMTRSGDVDNTVAPIPTSGSGLRLTNDARTLAYSRSSGSVSEIWIYDIARRISSRLSPERGASDAGPAFSPDGSQVYLRRELGNGKAALWRQPVSGATPGSVVLEVTSGEIANPQDLSPDGLQLLFAATRGPARGLWFLRLAGNGAPVAYLDGTLARAGHAALSPDGRLVAHASGPSALPQIFIQTFPDPSTGRWPVSGPGANYPRWRRDGRELFFVDGQGWLSAVAVAAGTPPQMGETSRLFQLPGFSNRGLQFAPYDVSPDGQRFIVQRSRSTAKPVSLTVAINWMASLDAAAAAK